MKKLGILFFFLPVAISASAQFPGTPYGLIAKRQVSTPTQPPTLPAGSGTFAGRICFDVAQMNDGGACGSLTTRQSEVLSANGIRADFSDDITRIQTYTFTPSGTVSNVRFQAVEAGAYAGQIIQNISGGNSGNNISTLVSCTVTYKSNLNGKASGKQLMRL